MCESEEKIRETLKKKIQKFCSEKATENFEERIENFLKKIREFRRKI